MFPPHGNGTKDIGRLRPIPRDGVPEHLMYSSQMDLQYLLYDHLQQFGDCYCEVCNENSTIDLVWQHKQQGTKRVIGLEVKASIESLIQVKKQLDKYRDWKLVDFARGIPVTESGEIVGKETPFFDDVWLVTMRDKPTEFDWTSGQLHYNEKQGSIEYKIPRESQPSGTGQEGERSTGDNPPRIETDFDLSEATAEYHLTARVAKHYRQRSNWISAEVPTTTPRNRHIDDGTVKRPLSKSKIDLVVVDHNALPEITTDTQIHGIEVKRQFNSSARDRLRNQLTTYLNSGIYSHVWVAVPYEHAAKACMFCKEEQPEAGVLALRNTDGIDQKRCARRQSFEKVPILKKKRDGYRPCFWEP